MTTREQWLNDAATELAEMITLQAGLTVPETYISVGFPKGHRGRSRAIGQCWSGEAIQDGKPHIFVCPTQHEAPRVLDILLHEMIHASLQGKGHRKEFAKAAAACGLIKPWTATTAGEELKTRLNAIATELGQYPHSPLTVANKVKAGSRLRLYMCECGVKVRVASDDFEATCRKCDEDFELQV